MGAYVEGAPPVLSWIRSVGVQRGWKLGFWVEWMELPFTEMGKAGGSPLREKAKEFHLRQIMLEKPFRNPWRC